MKSECHHMNLRRNNSLSIPQQIIFAHSWDKKIIQADIQYICPWMTYSKLNVSTSTWRQRILSDSQELTIKVTSSKDPKLWTRSPLWDRENWYSKWSCSDFGNPSDLSIDMSRTRRESDVFNFDNLETSKSTERLSRDPLTIDDWCRLEDGRHNVRSR